MHAPGRLPALALTLHLAVASGAGAASADEAPAAAPALAVPEGAATATIRLGNERLRALLRDGAAGASEAQRVRQVTAELRRLLDVGLLGRRALAEHWQEMSAAEQASFVSTLQAIVERQYVGQLRAETAYEVDYLGETAGEGGDVCVHTRIHTPGEPPASVEVDYLLHAGPAGAWRIVDVSTDGVSVSRNYRSQFHRIVVKDGIKGLLSRMRHKLGPEPRP